MPPFVSVVIPVYNRAHLLELVLQPLFEQTYPRECYEIIVVDDGSTDETASEAEAFGQRWDGLFTVIRQRNQGAGAARNTGIAAAQGKYVACIDSDCVAEATWISALVANAQAANADAVGGPIITGNTANPVCRYYAASRFYRHRLKNGRAEYLITGNILFRREAFVKVGGFETSGATTSEDVDISYRLVKAGYRIVVSDDGLVTHYGDPTTLGSFWKRMYLHGFSSVPLARRWPGVRHPGNQLLRHGGAIILSPLLAFRAARRDSIVWFPWFWLCVVIQHTAFCVGILDALRKDKR